MTAQSRTPAPTLVPVRTISTANISKALKQGYQDFLSLRGDLLFIGLLYPLIGMAATVLALNEANLPLLFPLLAGLTLLGPLVSAGFYEMARCREKGEKASWSYFFRVTKAKNFNDLMFVGMILIGIFALWILMAVTIYVTFMGAMVPKTITAFLTEIFTTSNGWMVIIIGNIVGLLFALVVLAISFVSLPMLVDRNVDAGLAIRTSLRAFAMNKGVCLQWGLRVAILLFLGSLPLLLGLAIVLPVLGYATWHLYDAIVDRSGLEPGQRRA